MTAQERDYEELLSRVLHSTTDQVEPVGDGLTRIRARLTEPWLKRQWWLLRSECMTIGWLVAVRSEPFLGAVRARYSIARSRLGTVWSRYAAAGAGGPDDHPKWLRWLAPALGAIAAWVSSHGPGRGHAGGRRRPPGPVMNWLRPALAVAGAVVLVVAGVFALGQLRQTIVGVSAGGSGGPATSGISGGNGPGRTNGYGNGRINGSSYYPRPGGNISERRGASGHPVRSPSPSPCASPTSSPINQSPSPSPSATTPAPTTSPTPTSTPTPTSSPSASSSSAPLSPLWALGNHVRGGAKTAALTCRPAPTSNPSPSNLANPA